MAKWCDEGEESVAGVFFNGDTAPDFYIGLYTNVTEPGEAAVLTDITEPSGNGYARQQVLPEDWTLSGSGVTAPQLTFTANGGSWGNVAGWFLCSVASGTAGILMAVESFVSPYTMTDGSTLKLTSTVTVG